MTRQIKATQRELLETGSEATAQRKIIAYWSAWHDVKYNLPEFALYHCPNGGSRDFIEACQLKLQGVRAGVPDLFLAWPSGGYGGLYIELKRPDGGTLSANQRAFLEYARRAKFAAFCCHGAENAISLLNIYLTAPEKLNNLNGLVFADNPFIEQKAADEYGPQSL